MFLIFFAGPDNELYGCNDVKTSNKKVIHCYEETPFFDVRGGGTYNFVQHILYFLTKYKSGVENFFY